ncbi:proteasome-type protease [Azospirillum sp.]|uniref:proteasome-type protease n=1 Tax=Azospirillum sp. TaxID=34012 RepID=UPI002D3224F1|nr:proteasome-type protease [Azospirillum sp.]HYD67847.1 proteasome-type protease [Azospirillum sp.]
MTYCVGLYLKDGLVMLSDTRTNAGVDHISTFSKMHVFEVPGERMVTLMTAGNLAISQSVITLLQQGVELDGEHHTILTVPSLFQAAQLVGVAIRHVWKRDGGPLREQRVDFDVSILVGGQIRERQMRLFQVYSAGNFIEATPDTAFFQIGDHKYGKPILDRALTYETSIEDGVKLVLISMDSTVRSNLSVGLPLDLLVYRRDALRTEQRRRIGEDDACFKQISEGWSTALREAFRALPHPQWP